MEEAVVESYKRIAKRMAYEQLVKQLKNPKDREILLKKDDKHVDNVLEACGIKISFN
tara:strand:- start:91 stop:261 length:171 start_codon:yes stop_codon:yes gene_type:complete